MATVATRLMTARRVLRVGEPPGEPRISSRAGRGRDRRDAAPGELHGVICVRSLGCCGTSYSGAARATFAATIPGCSWTRPRYGSGPDLMLFDDSRPLDSLSRKFTRAIRRARRRSLVAQRPDWQSERRISQYLRGVPLAWLVDPECGASRFTDPARSITVVDETEELTAKTPCRTCGCAWPTCLPCRSNQGR